MSVGCMLSSLHCFCPGPQSLLRRGPWRRITVFAFEHLDTVLRAVLALGEEPVEVPTKAGVVPGGLQPEQERGLADFRTDGVPKAGVGKLAQRLLGFLAARLGEL